MEGDADASVLVYGMPNEDATRIHFTDSGVVMEGRALQLLDRDAFIETVVRASGNRGDVVATNSSGVLEELPLSSVGVAKVQVGCAAGSVAIAAFSASADVASKPAAFTAAVSIVMNSLTNLHLGEVTPMVVVKFVSGIVTDSATSFGLDTFMCDKTNCAVFVCRPEASPLSFTHLTFEKANSKVDSTTLELVALPAIQPPESKETAPEYEATSNLKSNSNSRVRWFAVLFVVAVFFGMWIFGYPKSIYVSTSSTTTTAATSMLRGRTLQFNDYNSDDREDSGSGTYDEPNYYTDDDYFFFDDVIFDDSIFISNDTGMLEHFKQYGYWISDYIFFYFKH